MSCIAYLLWWPVHVFTHYFHHFYQQWILKDMQPYWKYDTKCAHLIIIAIWQLIPTMASNGKMGTVLWHMKKCNFTSSQRSSKAAFISTFNTSDSTSCRQSSSSWTWVLRSNSGCSWFTFFLSGLLSAATHNIHNCRHETQIQCAKYSQVVFFGLLCVAFICRFTAFALFLCPWVLRKMLIDKIYYYYGGIWDIQTQKHEINGGHVQDTCINASDRTRQFPLSQEDTALTSVPGSPSLMRPKGRPARWWLCGWTAV